jgi:hypothetical protein
MLQADSKEMYEAWIASLQRGIGAAFQRIHSIENTDNSGKLNNPNEQSGNGSIANFNNNKIKKLRMWEQLLKILVMSDKLKDYPERWITWLVGR